MERDKRQQKKEGIRSFLTRFKTEPCPLDYLHQIAQCMYFHGPNDHRRCPYSQDSKIVYQPQICKRREEHSPSECPYCHNSYQYEFHPLRYMTTLCQYYYDCQNIYCPLRHHSSQTKSEYFRFDINTFKTQQCHKETVHDKNICLYYHNNIDRRRSNFEDYQHMECKFSNCKKGNQCPFSHNNLERLYHPSRYKTKFCDKKLKGKPCSYGQFCSFAHGNDQIMIKLIGEMERTPQFEMYQYKTVWCPVTTDHNRSLCVYAHNIQDFRRDPRQYEYIAQKCPNWKVNENIKCLEEAGCEQGMRCKYCHGWKQYDYHPAVYSKRMQNRSGNIHTQSNAPQSPSIIITTTSPQHPPARKGSYKITEEAVNKKLNFEEPEKVKNKIDYIIHQQLNSKHNKSLYSNGAPFFKPQTTSSYGSKTTKAKSQHLSNSQNDKISQMEERGSISGNLAREQKHSKLQSASMVAAVIIQHESYTQDFQIFQPREYEKGFWMASSKERISKSCGRRLDRQILYSEEVYATIADNHIVQKLRKARINEIKLLNLREEQINSLSCLTPRQKSRLSKRLKDYFSQNKKSINYSSTLQTIFIEHNHEMLLKKMKSKKVREQKLVKLKKEEIEDLSFLTEEEKQDLPQIIEQYEQQVSESQFDELKNQIQKEVAESQSKTGEQFNAADERLDMLRENLTGSEQGQRKEAIKKSRRAESEGQ